MITVGELKVEWADEKNGTCHVPRDQWNIELAKTRFWLDFSYEVPVSGHRICFGDYYAPLFDETRGILKISTDPYHRKSFVGFVLEGYEEWRAGLVCGACGLPISLYDGARDVEGLPEPLYKMMAQRRQSGPPFERILMCHHHPLWGCIVCGKIPEHGTRKWVRRKATWFCSNACAREQRALNCRDVDLYIALCNKREADEKAAIENELKRVRG